MLMHHLRDLAAGQPARRRGPENPKPGRESTTTLRGSEDALPCANGSVSSAQRAAAPIRRYGVLFGPPAKPMPLVPCRHSVT